MSRTKVKMGRQVVLVCALPIHCEFTAIPPARRGFHLQSRTSTWFTLSFYSGLKTWRMIAGNFTSKLSTEAMMVSNIHHPQPDFNIAFASRNGITIYNTNPNRVIYISSAHRAEQHSRPLMIFIARDLHYSNPCSCGFHS